MLAPASQEYCWGKLSYKWAHNSQTHTQDTAAVCESPLAGDECEEGPEGHWVKTPPLWQSSRVKVTIDLVSSLTAFLKEPQVCACVASSTAWLRFVTSTLVTSHKASATCWENRVIVIWSNSKTGCVEILVQIRRQYRFLYLWYVHTVQCLGWFHMHIYVDYVCIYYARDLWCLHNHSTHSSY